MPGPSPGMTEREKERMSEYEVHPADGVEVLQALRKAASERILVLDGAMGTEIQALKLSEADFRGERFAADGHDLKGNNDLLILTQPDAIRETHLHYFRAGADIVETNTFSGTSIAQADYGLEAIVYELNRAGARLAREAAMLAEQEDGRRRVVAGAIGPTNRTLSISPDVNNPGYRAVTFDQVRDAYAEQVRGLVDGGAEIILIETIFDLSGRTLSGQTPTAFRHAIRHAEPFAVGLNCALGAREMRAHIEEIAKVADTLVCAYPNAGLPNEFGLYDERPEATASMLAEFADAGF